jgi:hypothetical protein
VYFVQSLRCLTVNIPYKKVVGVFVRFLHFNEQAIKLDLNLVFSSIESGKESQFDLDQYSNKYNV